jgi:predicted DNA-binding transcriptional regulator AlpA
VLNYKQVAALTGMGKSQVYSLYKTGVLPGYRFGMGAKRPKGLRFDPADIRAFMDSRRQGPPPPQPQPVVPVVPVVSPQPRRRPVASPPTVRKFL